MALSNVKVKMRLALRYSVVVGMNMQLFGVYVCTNESILSLTLDSEGKIFFQILRLACQYGVPVRSPFSLFSREDHILVLSK